MTRGRGMAAAAAALGLAGCTLGTTTMDELYRDHPAAEAPMLFAPSHLSTLRAAVDDRAALPARLSGLRIEPLKVTADLLGPAGQLVQLRGQEGEPWSSAERRAVLTGDTFLLSDAHLEELPARLARILAHNHDYGPLEGDARVDAVVVAPAPSGVRVEVQLRSGKRTQVVTLDGAGQLVREPAR